MTSDLDSQFVYGLDYFEPEDSDEEWSYIVGNPDYMISTHGRIWSSLSESFIKDYKMNNAGHRGVGLRSDGVRQSRYIHRLVAESHLSNQDKLPIVRHLDDDPSHNVVDNLAWGTQKDNMDDCVSNGHQAGVPSVKVRCTNYDTGFTEVFASQWAAARALGISNATISLALKHDRLSCGYKFEKVTDG